MNSKLVVCVLLIMNTVSHSLIIRIENVENKEVQVSIKIKGTTTSFEDREEDVFNQHHGHRMLNEIAYSEESDFDNELRGKQKTKKSE